MEKLLEVINCPESKKVKLVFFNLIDPAEIRWRSVKSSMATASWEEFLKTLHEQFYPPFLQRQKENEFLLLRQGLMSVVEYSSKFNELSRFATNINTEKVRASHFFEGLNLKIQKGIEKYSDFRDLCDRAREFEWILDKADGANKRKFSIGNNINKSKKPNNWVRKPFQPSTLVKPTVWKCRLCGKNHRGHSFTGKIICYKCKQEVHIVTEFRLGLQPGVGSSGATGTSGSSGNRNLNNSGKKTVGLHAISGYIDNLHEEFEGKVISGHFMVGNSSARTLFHSGADPSFISTFFFINPLSLLNLET